MLTGEPPDATRIPAGCRFHPRFRGDPSRPASRRRFSSMTCPAEYSQSTLPGTAERILIQASNVRGSIL